MDKNTVAVITGDVINSRTSADENWKGYLKEVFKQYTSQKKYWNIYRGDGFQIELSPEQALISCFHIKAAMAQIDSMGARMAIGLGEKSYDGKNVSESNGSAFIRSGECFEQLEKSTLMISTGSSGYDEQLNLMFRLLTLTTDRWPTKTAEVLIAKFKNRDAKQSMLAQKLKKTQSTISAALNRGGYDEIIALDKAYQNILLQL